MKILVLGDAMTDAYWHGDVRRVSPEAPVPIFTVDRWERREGAAANVANNIEAMGVPCERIFGRGERIHKIRAIARGQHFARLDFDYPQEPIKVDSVFMDAISRCSLVVMSDYGKGSLANVQELIQACGEKPVLVDPKGYDYDRYRGAALIKPNRDEMRELVGGWATQDELDFKARQFLLASGIASILLTQASEGMTLYTRAGTQHYPAEAAEVVDVSGAGETAIAAYAAALALGYAPAAQYANRAAGIACARQGTAIVAGEDVWLK